RFLAADQGLKLVDLAQLTRIAVTGKTASPPIFEVVSILGKAETLARLKTAAAAVAAGRGGAPSSPATGNRSRTRCAASGAPRTWRSPRSASARPKPSAARWRAGPSP